MDELRRELPKILYDEAGNQRFTSMVVGDGVLELCLSDSGCSRCQNALRIFVDLNGNASVNLVDQDGSVTLLAGRSAKIMKLCAACFWYEDGRFKLVPLIKRELWDHNHHSGQRALSRIVTCKQCQPQVEMLLIDAPLHNNIHRSANQKA